MGLFALLDRSRYGVLAGVAAEAEPHSCSGPIQKDLKFNCSDRANDTPGSPSGARRADPRPSPHVRALAALFSRSTGRASMK